MILYALLDAIYEGESFKIAHTLGETFVYVRVIKLSKLCRIPKPLVSCHELLVTVVFSDSSSLRCLLHNLSRYGVSSEFATFSYINYMRRVGGGIDIWFIMNDIFSSDF